MQYRPEIDGLRAIAVTSVIAYHAGIQSFGGGFVGVDVFFVISGYLITSILLNDLKTGRFSIAHFYERRMRRILPALFIVMFACIPFAWFWMTPEDMRSLSKGLISTPLFISNFLFWKQSGYFDTANELKPLVHTWSLAVEEQFYILFPPLLLLIWRGGRRLVLGSLIIACVLSLLLAEWGVHRYPEFTFFMLPTRAWEIALGAIVAVCCPEHENRPHNQLVREVGGLLGFLLVLYAVVFYNQKTPFPGLSAVGPTIGTALIIIFATHRTYTGKLLGSKPFVSVGLVSYSAYLWHQPVFAFARITNEEVPTTSLMLLLTLVSFALAYLSWRFIEHPFRDRGQFSQRQIFVYGAIGSLCFITVGIIGQGAYQFTRFRGMSENQLSALQTAIPSPERVKCHTGGESYLPPPNACEYFGRNIKVAVFGDSHAVELAYALAMELKPYDIGIKQFSFSGCPPTHQAPALQTSCAKWTGQAIDYLEKNTAITTIVVSYRLNQYLFGKHEKTYPSLPNMVSESERSEIWSSYISLLRHLNDSGKQVIVVLQAPEVRKRPEDLIFKDRPPGSNIVSVPTEWWHRRNAYVMEHLHMVPRNIKIINPADFFCDEVNCYLTGDGTSYYFDDDHMSVAGSAIIARRIVELSIKSKQDRLFPYN